MPANADSAVLKVLETFVKAITQVYRESANVVTTTSEYSSTNPHVYAMNSLPHQVHMKFYAV
jgi:hypothetical protein